MNNKEIYSQNTCVREYYNESNTKVKNKEMFIAKIIDGRN